MTPAKFSTNPNGDTRSSLLLSVYQEANMATARSASVDYSTEGIIYREVWEITERIEQEAER
jgi:hypothetical protein